MDWRNKKALLYRRISTDDQSTYSLSDQQERLEKFCQVYHIPIVKDFWDDYSAKTFERPGWKEMIAWIKANRGKANLVIFTNWTRFSRCKDMGQTYFQIANLNRLGVEPQAIEQVVDLEIPESYHLLSMYITTGVVENLRRASNTRYGMRKAMKSGHWCHKSPFGYRNARDEANKPILLIVPDKARIIEDIFTDYLEGREPQLLMKRAFSKGLQNKGHSTFNRIITNHLYAGLIRIESWKDEPEQIVKGIHSPIISEDIFWAVQNKLHGKHGTKGRIFDETIPLRGVIRCGECGNHLTGGKSRGKSGRYWFYYRCLRCTGNNHSSARAHTELADILSAISLKEPYIQTLITEVDKGLKEVINANYHEAEKLTGEIKAIEISLASLEEKYIGNKLGFETYEKYFAVYRGELADKRLKLESISGDKEEIIELFSKALPKMQNLKFLFESVSLESKQQLLRLVFIGGLFKRKEGFYTPELNSLFDVYNLEINYLQVGNKEVFLENNLFSRMVPHIPARLNSPNPSEVTALLEFVLKLAA